jgi:hypothetical protein
MVFAFCSLNDCCYFVNCGINNSYGCCLFENVENSIGCCNSANNSRGCCLEDKEPTVFDIFGCFVCCVITKCKCIVK